MANNSFFRTRHSLRVYSSNANRHTQHTTDRLQRLQHPLALARCYPKKETRNETANNVYPIKQSTHPRLLCRGTFLFRHLPLHPMGHRTLCGIPTGTPTGTGNPRHRTEHEIRRTHTSQTLPRRWHLPPRAT